MKIILQILLLVAFQVIVVGQVGIGEVTPNINAILDLTNSENKGLLIGSTNLEQTNSPNPMTQHVSGMVVFNTSNSGDVSTGMYYNNGLLWIKLEPQEEIIKLGDIRYGVIDADNGGWYILNGRAVSSLPEPARTNAIGLGFTTNIPNMSGRFIKGMNTTESLFSTGGSNSFLINRVNLPNLTLTGTTNGGGSHSHSYTDRGSGMWHGQAGAGVTNNTNIAGETRTTGAAGNHNHTMNIPTGGTGAAVTLLPAFMSLQTFIYLGN